MGSMAPFANATLFLRFQKMEEEEGRPAAIHQAHTHILPSRPGHMGLYLDPGDLTQLEEDARDAIVKNLKPSPAPPPKKSPVGTEDLLPVDPANRHYVDVYTLELCPVCFMPTGQPDRYSPRAHRECE